MSTALCLGAANYGVKLVTKWAVDFNREACDSLRWNHPETQKTGKSGLHFKIHWKGYGEADDTWEPIEGLSGCEQKMKEFIENGFKASILPLPGSVDVVCGGPPCQGISGFNRFRNSENPLEDPKNKQLKAACRYKNG
ncbi:unnamed protein product [Cuscuta campestris]|uniref:Chromo domain-containing protein n=1 Tax=Cuscuta campestris TaxID=132261 RepID=A0A484LMY2_9ASTE|nr:unnamed protein product [Cuscuta campestris]